MSSPATAHEPTTSPLPTMMTAVTARSYGGPEVLATEELPVPTPQAGELLVEVRASSLNALDWHFLTGTPYLMRLMFGMRRPKRFVRGADVAGVVVAVGEGVTRFAVGDSVFGEGPGGGCGQYLTVNATSVVAIPDGVSFENAGATPVAGLTALQGLRTHGDVQPGERVLINGAAGHALDFDDVNRTMHGHPTVAVLPAVLTAATDRRHAARHGPPARTSRHDVASAIVTSV